MPRLALIVFKMRISKKYVEVCWFWHVTLGIDPPEWQSGLVWGPDLGVGDEGVLGGVLRRRMGGNHHFLTAGVQSFFGIAVEARAVKMLMGCAGYSLQKIFVKMFTLPKIF
ncbi:hypothetical protein [Methanoregula sp.]|uniref:hypothetical protein n=1 Tax=Methanoregula sp. TaxID=2052170 RepID=UPI003568AFB8